MHRGLLRLRPGLLLRATANANAPGCRGAQWAHVRAMGSAKGNPQEDYWPIKVQIGKREVVGFGSNGEEVYLDDVHHPFPAIRFKEDAGEIAVRKRERLYHNTWCHISLCKFCFFFLFQKLREKERGDWKKLTVEEKKQLYRASFCQTLSEVEAHTGEWKGVLGISLIFTALGVWGYILLKMFGRFMRLSYE